MPGSTIDEYRNSLVEYLRYLESQESHDKQRQADAMSDDELLRKWMWKGAIYGVLICYIGLPVALTLLRFVIPGLFIGLLWNLVQLAMGAVGIIFCLAIYYTVKRKES